MTEDNPFNEIVREAPLTAAYCQFPRSLRDDPNRRMPHWWMGIQNALHLPSSHLAYLEIGAGCNLVPATGLARMDNRVDTLDADWSSRFSNMTCEQYLELETQGEELLIPKSVGETEGVVRFQGDLAYLDHQRSALRSREYDIAYFWGSMDYTGICSSIDVASAAQNVSIHIPLVDRISKACDPKIKRILAVAAHFNGHLDESWKGLDYASCSLADLGIFYSALRPATTITYFLQDEENLKRRKYLNSAEIDLLLSDPFDRTINSKRASRMGRADDYQALRMQLEQVPAADREKIRGTIDAVAIEFAD